MSAGRGARGVWLPPEDYAECYKTRLSPLAGRVLASYVRNRVHEESRRIFHPPEPIKKKVLIFDTTLNTAPTHLLNSGYHEYFNTSIIQSPNSNTTSGNNNFAFPENPRVEDLLNTSTISSLENCVNEPIHNFDSFENKHITYFQKSISMNTENILCPVNNIKIDDAKCDKVASVSENNIDWDNMIDSEALFSSECDLDNISSINKHITTIKVLQKTTPKQEKKIFKNQSNSIPGKKKSPLTIGVTKEPTLKKRYKQRNIGELVLKKKKNKPSGIQRNQVSIKNFRKKPYTKVVQDWLKTVDPNNAAEGHNCVAVDTPEATTNLTETKDIVETTSKNTDGRTKIQSKLTNKGGILKFSTKVTKQINGQDRDMLSVVATKPDGENTLSIKSNEQKSIANFTKPKHINTAGTQIVPNMIGSEQTSDRDSVIVEKAKKRTSRFVVPIKSQMPVKDVDFDIINLNKTNILEFTNANIENSSKIILTLVYRNGLCQLNRHSEDNCTVEGIMIGTNDQTYYFITKTDLLECKRVRSFLKMALTITGNKLCYEAKDVIIFAAECLMLDPYEISENFLDAKVACFLLDPDKPPQSFADVQNMLMYTPEYAILTEHVAQRTAWSMTLLEACWDIIPRVLTESSLWNIFLDMEMKLLPILAGLQTHGMRVDAAGLDGMKEVILAKMKRVEQECYRSIGKEFQINSTVQLRAILYEDLKLDTKCNIKIKDTLCLGAKSTSEAMLKSLAESHPLPKLILEYRHLHKALATFVNGIAQHAAPAAGEAGAVRVVRATWLQAAAATGRIACHNPNLQAIPKTPFELNLYPQHSDGIQQVLHLRSVYLPREGQVLLAADFQHIECRVFAHLSGDTTLIDIFSQDGDFFRALAEKWLGKRLAEVTCEDRERTKRMVYASMYGAGTNKLVDILSMNYDQTLTVVSSFNRTFPSLKTFGQRVIDRCRQSGGVLATPCGRRRKLTNILSENFALKAQAERQAVNFMIQGSAADLCKAAMISTAARLRLLRPPVRCELLLQIHDELVWEVAEDDLTRVRDVVKEAMEGCGKTCGVDMLLPVSISWGKNWAEMGS